MMLFRGLAVAILAPFLLMANDANATDTNTSKQQRLNRAIQHEIQMEEKYAKEQKFYGPDEYDLKSKEVDPDSLSDIQLLEPDYTDNYGACDSK